MPRESPSCRKLSAPQFIMVSHTLAAVTRAREAARPRNPHPPAVSRPIEPGRVGHAARYDLVARILHKNNLSIVKSTRKPGLSKAQRRARLNWCLDHANWTIKDLREVIWSDETSVILVHVWCILDEAYESTVVRPRWKGFSSFMWWSRFTYDSKGPYHIWRAETRA